MEADGRPQLRGDEAQLFLEYGTELDRTVSRLVGTTRSNVEDACGFAWMQFVRYQPERDRHWRGWLVQVARREALRLEEVDRRAPARIASHSRSSPGHDVADPRADIEPRLELQEALEALKELRPRLQRIAFLRGLGLTHEQIGELTGDSMTRVGQLVRRASEALWTAAEKRQERETPAPPRVARLRALEREPPPWLTGAIGGPPTGRDTSVTHILLWRRAAVALDDYRRRRGELAAPALESPPDDPRLASMHSAAWRTVQRYRDELERGRGRTAHVRER
jgi:DNA-directed RNA polymerase specialized sigma24 family protein